MKLFDRPVSVTRARGLAICAPVLAAAIAAAVAFASPSARAVSPGATAPACMPGTTVGTSSGPICGIVVNGDSEWLGIPYAAPPIGALRWRSPQPPVPWATTLPATAFANECIQGSGPSPIGSEDCLYLNVIRPPGPAPARGLPVLVHIHPGGFVEGNGNGDYTLLANSGDEVVVSMNYRLGIFGFLADSALGPHSGDYGLQDQQAALRWVKQNIRSFGGDPANVTIFGESAGAASVCDQLASPTAAHLFDGAISSSGEYNNLLGVAAAVPFEDQDCKSALPTQAVADHIGTGFAASVGCSGAADVADCLRSVPAADAFRAAGSGYQYGGHGTVGPTLNGINLPRTLRQALRTGAVNRVPIITGNGRDENVVGLPTSTTQYAQLVQAQYRALAPRLLAMYPAWHYPSPLIAWRTLAADSNTICPALVTDRELARWMPVYGYEIDDGNAPPAVFLPPTQANGAYHAADWYVYVSGLFAPPPPNPDEAALQAQEIAEVSSFAHVGAPSAAIAPPWPLFKESSALMSFAPAGDSQVIPAGLIAATHHCGFWDRVAPGADDRATRRHRISS